MKTARRFLLASSLARLVAKGGGAGRQIVEGYLSVQPGNTQFVRLQADECHLVLPSVSAVGEVVEDLAPLPRVQAEGLFNLCIAQISYDQIHLPTQGRPNQRTYLDRIVYPISCDVLSIEFDDEQQAEAFEAPLWYGPEVTHEYTYDRRYIALNGLHANPEVPLSNQQLEAVLDMLEQMKKIIEPNGKSAAQEVIDALGRTLETSGLLKGAGPIANPLKADLKGEPPHGLTERRA